MRAALVIAAGFVATPGSTEAPCRQALALGLDVSGSVDGGEYRLQLDGLAAALRERAVIEAMLSVPSAPVHLAIFEWSEPGHQRLLLDWQMIAGPADLERIAAMLEATGRRPAPPGTALGSAMRFGTALLEQRRDCWKRTLDLSGDGKHNIGPHPREVKRALSAQSAGGVTLNALVIGSDAPTLGALGYEDIGELSAYFSAWVIFGPGAFVETALGYEAYREAMVRKLIRELEGLTVSALPDTR